MANNATFIKFITSTTGTDWVSLSSVKPVDYVTVINNTGTTLSFRRTGDTSAEFQLPTNTVYTFGGINDSAQLQSRRTDTSNTQVTAYCDVEWFGAQ